MRLGRRLELGRAQVRTALIVPQREQRQPIGLVAQRRRGGKQRTWDLGGGASQGRGDRAGPGGGKQRTSCRSSPAARLASHHSYKGVTPRRSQCRASAACRAPRRVAAPPTCAAIASLGRPRVAHTSCSPPPLPPSPLPLPPPPPPPSPPPLLPPPSAEAGRSSGEASEPSNLRRRLEREPRGSGPMARGLASSTSCRLKNLWKRRASTTPRRAHSSRPRHLQCKFTRRVECAPAPSGAQPEASYLLA